MARVYIDGALVEDDSMSKSPFIDDPRDLMRQQIAMAVASPIEAVRVIHLRAAEYQAELAKTNDLPLNPVGERKG